MAPRFPTSAPTDYDVIVAGGGPSGAVAAIAAARNGARTFLFEKHPFLGGSLTAMGVGPMMSFHNPAGRQVVKGIPQEIVDRLTERGASPGHIDDTTTYCSTVTPFDAEALKAVLEDMALEAGVTLLYHAQLAAVACDRGLEGVTLCTKAGLLEFRSKIFIDATGDGDLAFQAGTPFQKGRESDQKTQPMTMNLKVANVDMARVRAYIEEHPDDFYRDPNDPAWLDKLRRSPRLSAGGFRKAWEEAKARGEITIPREYLLFFETATPGVVIINTSRIQDLDPNDPFDLTRAEILGRRQCDEIFRFVRKHCPGFENAIRCDGPAQIGVRESRHVRGLYRLTADDLLNQTDFPDAVARGGYPIDIHSPDAAETHTRHLPPDGSYAIPLRCLLVEKPDNLIIAGRCLSATAEAFAAVRVTPISMAIGQAAGTAAALAVRHQSLPRDVDVPELQQTLRAQGAIL
jgi:hypothetical protein